MNTILQCGVAWGLLGMLQVQVPIVPGTADAPIAELRQVQVPVVPGTADAPIAELRDGFPGPIIPAPVSAGTLGAPGLATRNGTVRGAGIARGFVSPYVAGWPRIIDSGPSTVGYFTSSPVNPGVLEVPETAANSFEAPEAVTSQEVLEPTITNNGNDTTMNLGSIVVLGRPGTAAGINTGFGLPAINAGFGAPANNLGFGTQSINAGFGTRSINLGFGTIPGTPYGTQGLTGPKPVGRLPR